MPPFLMRAALAALALPTLVRAAMPAPPDVVTEAQVLEAIRVFDANACGNLATPARSTADANDAVQRASNTLMKFAQESDAVVVDLGPESVTWCDVKKGLSGVPNASERGLLLAAYLAGSIRSQLSSGKADSNPYAGWVHMIPVYKAMKLRENVRIPEVEPLVAKLAAGTLADYAAVAEQRALKRLENTYGKANPVQPADSESSALASARQQ